MNEVNIFYGRSGSNKSRVLMNHIAQFQKEDAEGIAVVFDTYMRDIQKLGEAHCLDSERVMYISEYDADRLIKFVENLRTLIREGAPIRFLAVRDIVMVARAQPIEPIQHILKIMEDVDIRMVFITHARADMSNPQYSMVHYPKALKAYADILGLVEGGEVVKVMKGDRDTSRGTADWDSPGPLAHWNE